MPTAGETRSFGERASDTGAIELQTTAALHCFVFLERKNGDFPKHRVGRRVGAAAWPRTVNFGVGLRSFRTLFLGEKFREAHDDDEIRRRGSCVNWYEDEAAACETVAAAEENTTKGPPFPPKELSDQKRNHFFFSPIFYFTRWQRRFHESINNTTCTTKEKLFEQ
jgi:hypothetical protein